MFHNPLKRILLIPGITLFFRQRLHEGFHISSSNGKGIISVVKEVPVSVCLLFWCCHLKYLRNVSWVSSALIGLWNPKKPIILLEILQWYSKTKEGVVYGTAQNYIWTKITCNHLMHNVPKWSDTLQKSCSKIFKVCLTILGHYALKAHPQVWDNFWQLKAP